MKEQGEKMKEAVEEVTDVLNAPGNILNNACDGVEEVGSTIAGGFESAWNEVTSIFGRRKR